MLYAGSTVFATALAAAVGSAGVMEGPAPSAGVVAAALAVGLPSMVAGTSAIVKYGGGFGSALERTGADFKVGMCNRL